jgi:uncharacterized protein YgiM (DUF1202 family)
MRLVTVLSLLLLVACSGGEDPKEPPATGPATEVFTHELAAETTWYRDGPQQSRPPDGQLPAGTRVRVVEEAGSYVRIAAENGVTGFVAADALKKLE